MSQYLIINHALERATPGYNNSNNPNVHTKIIGANPGRPLTPEFGMENRSGVMGPNEKLLYPIM